MVYALYRELRGKFTNNIGELHYLMLYYTINKKCDIITYNSFNSVFSKYFTINNIKVVPLELLDEKKVKYHKKMDGVIEFILSYPIRYNKTYTTLMKDKPPKLIKRYDTLNEWDETEELFDSSGIFLHAFMNHHLNNNHNINWYKSMDNIHLNTKDYIVYLLSKIKYIVETTYDNPNIIFNNRRSCRISKKKSSISGRYIAKIRK